MHAAAAYVFMPSLQVLVDVAAAAPAAAPAAVAPAQGDSFMCCLFVCLLASWLSLPCRLVSACPLINSLLTGCATQRTSAHPAQLSSPSAHPVSACLGMPHLTSHLKALTAACVQLCCANSSMAAVSLSLSSGCLARSINYFATHQIF